jgi:membrane protein DedA with SNARE-associated domain
VLTSQRRRELRRWRRWLSTPTAALAGLALLVAITVIVLAVFWGDLPDAVDVGAQWARTQLAGHGYLSAYPLLYIEESGVPLLAPGDVFMLYVGAHAPHNALALTAAWLGFILVVVAGATNLYLISRRLGRNFVHSRVAGFIHLTPERMERAEAWFQRYGWAAIIFGRHVPGLRVPITVACGVTRVSYPIFAASVAISTAIWAGFWVGIGALYGERVERYLRGHSEIYWIGGALLALGVGIVIARRVMAARE